jgi:hypothetical protein
MDAATPPTQSAPGEEQPLRLLQHELFSSILFLFSFSLLCRFKYVKVFSV